PVLRLKLPVPCSFVHVHTLGDEVLHFRLEAAQEKEHWLQLLQSLTFINNDKIDWLEPILQRNKQLALLATKGVAGVFTQVMSEQLLPGSQNAGITIDPLMKYLDEAFANTPTGRALPVLNKRIAAGGRREWLELNGLKIPTPDTLGTSALFKFIDGKTLSRKDSLDLSKWLEEAGGQNVGLLAAMQKKEFSFVPTLNLMFSWNSKRVIDLLEQASASSMTFGVSVTDQLLEPIAQKLSDVMASPQSRVASFDDATVWQAPAPEGPRIRELLRECIRHCTKLQYVSGSPGVLSLLDSNVPEIWLRGRNYSTRGQEQFQTALQRILSVGGVAKLSWESGAQRLPSEESEKVAQAITEAVAKANATLPGERGVYQVQLSGYEGKDDDKHPTEKKVVVQLVAH
ncbi:hypothetical protein, partial [Variovorax guangxiensis]|uniref:hypothetical protein n=1 Tax=Variovorax guangxiensis TaxID=1775474 RepID=UPI00286AE2D1